MIISSQNLLVSENDEGQPWCLTLTVRFSKLLYGIENIILLIYLLFTNRTPFQVLKTFAR